MILTIGVAASAALFAARPRASVEPDADTVFTSTREVTALRAEPDGTLWAATSGGVLRRSPDGAWRKWTRLNGLPSNEALTVTGETGQIAVGFPTARAKWDGSHWVVAAGQPPTEAAPGRVTCSAEWRGAPCSATLDGLRYRVGEGWRTAALPPSPGTHISALLPHGADLWAALYGDGLWSFDGTSWRRLEMPVPEPAREMTALAESRGTLWLGTRRAGLWACDGKTWLQTVQREEPYAHNVQSLATFRGALYAGTLEDGLVVRAPGGWSHVTVGELSSNAPRQMAVFRDRLYVRNGNGKVDSFDGEQWERDVFAKLPRKQVSALATDGSTLYLAQWGGWSEWDGSAWTHHLDLPGLQGVPVTALRPDGDTLWAGTQGRGLAEIQRTTGRIRWHNAVDGLPDDWVTALLRAGPNVYAGTFVGGLARWTGKEWAAVPELKGQNVTALEPDGRGGIYAGTRSGVRHTDAGGRWALLSTDQPFIETEVQALSATADGIWIGARTGLDYVRTAG